MKTFLPHLQHPFLVLFSQLELRFLIVFPEQAQSGGSALTFYMSGETRGTRGFL